MNHSQECLAKFAKMKKAREEFEEKFPDFCRACGATGWKTYSDRVPYGSTYVSMESAEFCEYCIGLDCCPRCGALGTYNESIETFTCKCGYNSGDPQYFAGAPERPNEYDHCICGAC